MNRGDINANMIRSTQTRVKFKGCNFEVFNTPDIIHRGDVCVESSLHGHYAGEVQIAKADMENTGMTNVIGHIREEEVFLWITSGHGRSSVLLKERYADSN